MKYLLLLLAVLPSAAPAARFDVLSSVEFLVTLNPTVFGTTDGDWISLFAVTNVGTCGTSPNPNNDQRVVFKIPSTMEKAFNVALASQVNGFRLQVSVDDSIVDPDGYCIVRWVTARSATQRDASEKELPVIRLME